MTVGPGPKWKSQASLGSDGSIVLQEGWAQERRRQITLQLMQASIADAIYFEGWVGNQSFRANNDSVLRQAGITANWPIFKGRCRAANLAIPGYTPGVEGINLPEQIEDPAALRVFAQENMPDLIDPAAEQPAGWDWW